LQAAIECCLQVVRSTDKTTGTFAFIFGYFIFCGILIYVNSRWPNLCRKKTARRIRKPVSNVAGKRSSQRIRLQKHELVFIEKVTPEEFERQKGAFTKDQIARLEASKEYKQMKREKGRYVENWNWQANESKYGAESDISSEYDIISNY
jgi:hypothetical protein